MSIRKEYNDLLAQRAAHLQAAEAAVSAKDTAAYKAAMDAAKGMDSQLEDMQALIAEQDRYAAANAMKIGTESTAHEMAEMGKALAAGKAVRLSMKDTIFAPHDSTTLATGTLVAPSGAGLDIRSGFTAQVPSLIDQVSVVDLSGMSAYEEPYVVAEQAAQVGTVASLAGTARTVSDPTFAKAKIAPYEVDVTSYVDRNLGRLNPADYAAKIQAMALRALRRKINNLIVNGDGETSHVIFGLLNAKNTAGANIFNGLGSLAIDENLLDKLVFGYGGSEEVGGNARLILTKATLKALGALRGTNEKRRLLNITPDAGNPNTGMIENGGLIVPYTIVSAIGDTAVAYGDPANYELGLFGDYVIRVDESVKAIERMNTILGDIMVGGNLVVDKGATTATLTAAG